MEKFIQTFCQQNQVKGLSVTLHDHGCTVYQYQYGYTDQSKAHKITSATLFGIGSISKLFTTVALLQLQEQKSLHLDDSIAKFIPELKQYKDITIRMLLNHSSGLSGVHFKKTFSHKVKPEFLDELLTFTSREGCISKPGKFNVYCNDGFSLAQLIIERVSQLDFPSYVKEFIAQPLHMNHIDFPIHPFNEASYAHPKGPFELDYPQEYVNGIGTGGIYCSSEDLCTFLDHLMDGKLLSKESFAQMTQNEIQPSFFILDNTTRRYGLGFDCVELENIKALGYTAMSKGGATFGYLAQAIIIPSEQLSISVVMASDDGASSVVAQKVLVQYLTDYKQATIQKQTLPNIKLKTDNIEGVYGAFESNIFKLYSKENTYFLEKYDRRIHDFVLLYQDLIFKDGQLSSPSVGHLLEFNQSALSVLTYDHHDYLFVEYTDKIIPSVKQRLLLAQKITPSNEAITLDLKDDLYIKINEDIDQRSFSYTPILFPIYRMKHYENILLYPYPLKIISKTEAIPFAEIPGDYSREMAKLTCLDDEHIQNGQYIFKSIKTLTPLPDYFLIENDYTHWFICPKEPFTIEADGRIRIVGIDDKGILTYDSDLTQQCHYHNASYIGFTGKGASFKIRISS